MRADWIEVELDEVCQINMGQSPPSSTYNEEGNGLPFFQGKAEFTNLHPKVVKWCTDPKKIAEKGDILISVRAPVGSTNIADQKCAIGRGLAAITFPFGNGYLWYYLQLIEKKLDSLGTGTTFKAISGKILRSQKLPLPPLPEQRAIVARIEEQFSELDHAVSSLQAAQAKLDIYRQAVLKKAFEGGFTSGENWKFVELNSVSEKIQDGSHFSPKLKLDKRESGFYPYVTSKNIRNGFLELDNLEFVDKDFHDSIFNRCDPRKGDLLLTKDGVNTGNVAINTFEEPISLLSSVCLIRPKVEFLSVSFLMYFIQSPTGFRNMTGEMTGTAIKRIILKKIKQTKIPLPPIQEQTQIVQEIESRLSVADKLAETILTSLQKAEALRQSILKKAFEGRLLSDAEVEACRKEADWEPVEKLLERIKQEKRKKEIFT
ncbi:MAG: type I site-specific restriction-modification system HsdS family specificity subunit [Algoriphagus marincola HL-49]|uniref:Type I site-specific restriction-modification system HsdS family specificity subunit n=1 Tax=Algoriphagus marincola HL-49 TaxID=1305737 RepID=A0A0N8KH80_9BACT|nr:MAG: type I site-specific restriction-modification system HsdS family specificity subunit [Algoriphagus marincola HL-49]